MKLRLIEHRRLTGGHRVTPEGAPFRPTDAPIEEKRERLYRAVERTQAFMHKQQSTGDVMALVRERYPAPLYFIESNRQALERAGLSRLDAFYYAMIPHLTRTSLSQQWGMNPLLDRFERMAAYLKTLYVGVHVECFYAILLDRGGRLIRSVLLQKGGVDNAPFYLGQLLSVALEEGVRFVVLAHNHPGGTPKPSREDVLCTLRALNAFAPLKIPMLDHVIVAREKVLSIRSSGVTRDVLWTGIQPGSRIVRNWLIPSET